VLCLGNGQVSDQPQFLPPDKSVRVGEQGLSTLIGCEDEVANDDHPHRKHDWRGRVRQLLAVKSGRSPASAALGGTVSAGAT
jgi:hypothetical protein